MRIPITRPSRFHTLVLGMVGLLALTVGGFVFGKRTLSNDYVCLQVVHDYAIKGVLDVNSGATYGIQNVGIFTPYAVATTQAGNYAAYVVGTNSPTVPSSLYTAYIQNAGITNRALIRNLPYQFEPWLRWSPDGQWLIYEWQLANGRSLLGLADYSGEILTESSDNRSDSLWWAGWSADSSYVAYVTYPQAALPGPEIVVTFLSASDWVTVKQSSQPAFKLRLGSTAWSPVGHWFAYVAVGNEPRLVLVSPGEGIERAFSLPDYAGDERLVWSPDGRYIAVESPRQDPLRMHLDIFGTDGREYSNVEDRISTPDSEKNSLPADLEWSDDGRFVLYARPESTSPDKYDLVSFYPDENRYEVLGVDIHTYEQFPFGIVATYSHEGVSSVDFFSPDGRKTVITADGYGDCCEFHLSPDGAILVLVSTDKNRHWKLDWWRIGEATIHHLDSSHAGQLEWSENSQWFSTSAVSVGAATGSEIDVVNVDTEAQFHLTDTSSVLVRALPSPEGNVIALDMGSDLLIAAANGQWQRVVAHGLVEFGAMTWSPDGKYLAFVEIPVIGSPIVQLVTADGSPIRQFKLLNNNRYSVGLTWSQCN